MKNKKTVIAALAALAVLIAVFAGIYVATRPETQKGAKGFTVEVVHKDGSVKSFDYRTDGEYLGPVLVEKGLILMDDVELGMFDTVDGEQAVWSMDNGWWALYVNGEFNTVGINDTPIRDGDTFRLEYTTDYVG